MVGYEPDFVKTNTNGFGSEEQNAPPDNSIYWPAWSEATEPFETTTFSKLSAVARMAGTATELANCL